MQNTVFRILIVDDNQDIHKDIKNIVFEESNESSALSDLKARFTAQTPTANTHRVFTITSAFQGEEGFQMVQNATAENAFAVSFVDVRMPPGEDGIKTAKKILQHDSNIQVVICTAYSDYSWEEIFTELGLTDRLIILKKPFDPVEIRQLVYSLTTKWELGKKLQNHIVNLNAMVEERTKHLLETKVKLEHIVSLVKATLESTADGVIAFNSQKQLLNYNEQFAKQWNLKVPLQPGVDSTDILRTIQKKLQTPNVFSDHLQRIFSDQQQDHCFEINTRDGRIFEFYSRPLLVQNNCIGCVFTFRDITVKRHTTSLLLLKDRALQASVDGIFIIDCMSAHYPIVYVNTGFERITGYKAKYILQKDSQVLFHDKHAKNLSKLHHAIQERSSCNLVLYYKHNNGQNFWAELHFSPVVNNDQLTHFVGIIIDITQRKQMEDEITRQANYDSLTGLPNRKFGLEILETTIKNAKEANQIFALIYLDLDRFKLINDNLGHDVGDALLKIIAMRMSAVLRKADTIARLGGDEFIIIAPVKQVHDCDAHVLQRVLSVFENYFHIESHELHVTCSIGVCFYPTDGLDTVSLMKHADQAMYTAKQAGRNRMHVFKRNDQTTRHQLDFENALHHAINRNEFSLVYQPIIHLQTNTVVAVEALLRWNHPALGVILPEAFLETAEDSDLLIPIGNWVIQQACRQMAEWLSMGIVLEYLSINISPFQFRNKKFIHSIEKILTESAVSPSHVALELTENVVFRQGNVAKTLTQLCQIGVKLFIDDFGTGYSNLRYFAEYPINGLKIDRSFVKDMHNEKIAALITSIIALANALKIQVIAEGVEDATQLAFLQEKQCDFAQGFYFSQPLCVKDCAMFLRNYKR